jgi:hypothetical protein
MTCASPLQPVRVHQQFEIVFEVHVSPFSAEIFLERPVPPAVNGLGLFLPFVLDVI